MTNSTDMTNTNLLGKHNFKLNFDRTPLVDFTCTKASIPDLSLPSAIFPTPFVDIKLPGDKIEIGDLNIEFNLIENMGNYIEVFNWLRKIGFPDNYGESKSTEEKYEEEYFTDMTNDAVLEILTNNDKINISVYFQNVFPISLSSVDLDSTVNEFEEHIVSASFAFTNLTIKNNT